MSKFDDIIQQKANEHEAPVPHGVWDNIIKEKKKRRFIFFWWIFGILLLGLSIIGSYNYNNSTGNKKIATIKNEPATPATNISTGDNANASHKEPGLPVEKTNNQIITGNSRASTIASTETGSGNEITNDKINPAGKTNQAGQSTNNNTTAGAGNKRNRNNKQAATYLAASPKTQMATSPAKQNSQQKNTVKEAKADESWAGNKNTIKKEKGKSTIKTIPGETETLTENTKENKKEIAVTETTDPRMNDAGEQPVIAESKNIAALPSSTTKALVVDSVQNKQVLTTPVENKKTQAVVNKPAKKHSWFIDLGIAPVLPIEQYDQSTTFSRTELTNNNLSEFSGKLVSTKIDPSVAFFLSVRRSMNKKFSIGLGLQYLQLKEQVTISGTETNTKYTVVDRLVNNINGPQLVSDTVETVTQGERKISAVNSYTFLSIPVFVQYDFIQKQSWSLGVVGGLYVNVYGKYKNEINENKDAQLVASSQTNNQNSSVGMSVYGGFRFGKRIRNKFEFFATPSITLALGSQDIQNSLLNKKIQQAGLNIGLSYKLN